MSHILSCLDRMWDIHLETAGWSLFFSLFWRKRNAFYSCIDLGSYSASEQRDLKGKGSLWKCESKNIIHSLTDLFRIFKEECVRNPRFQVNLKGLGGSNFTQCPQLPSSLTFPKHLCDRKQRVLMSSRLTSCIGQKWTKSLIIWLLQARCVLATYWKYYIKM